MTSPSTTMPQPCNVLFLCVHNSARSVIAECVMNRLGQGRCVGHSAGSHPRGEVHPYALDLLQQLEYDTSRLRSKSWNEFTVPGAPRIDCVITVCDDAANEACPYWPGQPVTAHWGLPDPSAAEGNEADKRDAFAATHRMLLHRIGLFVSLPLASLDVLSLRARLAEIGTSVAPVHTS